MHSGHRERMRTRIEENGLDSLADHELLEYLLYFVQPRVNTNEQAHRLMERFGSLSDVFNADPEVLKEVEGIGPKSSSFLSLFPEIARRYFLDTYDAKSSFCAFNEIISYVKKMYLGVKKETVAVVLLDSASRLISSEFISVGSFHSVFINRHEILRVALLKDASYVILVHNHPSNKAYPSSQDYSVTVKMSEALSLTGFQLLDHIILCPNGSYYSFAEKNALS